MEPNHGRLLNEDHEVLATGVFEINIDRQEVTFRPIVDCSLLDRETGPLLMELDDGRTLELAARYLRFRLYSVNGERQTIYRIHFALEPEAQQLPVTY